MRSPENQYATMQGLTPIPLYKGADLVLILTEWDAVRKLDLKKLKGVMACPVIVDGRNVFKPEEIRALGFTYHSVGRD